MTPSQLALLSLWLFFSYWFVTEWFDLFPWNDLRASKRSDQWKGTAVYGGCTVAFSLAIGFGVRWGIAASAIAFFILFCLEVANWWVPYLFGVHPWEIDREAYAHQFSRTVRFLPAIGDRNVPDAQHVVLNAVTLFASVGSAIAWYRG